MREEGHEGAPSPTARPRLELRQAARAVLGVGWWLAIIAVLGLLLWSRSPALLLVAGLPLVLLVVGLLVSTHGRPALVIRFFPEVLELRDAAGVVTRVPWDCVPYVMRGEAGLTIPMPRLQQALVVAPRELPTDPVVLERVLPEGMRQLPGPMAAAPSLRRRLLRRALVLAALAAVLELIGEGMAGV